MKIAVTVDAGEISAHFGHCEGYMIYEVVDNRVADQNMLPNPGHRPGFLPGYLAERGVNCIMSGGLGNNARRLFEENGITVITGIAGDPDAAVAAYLDRSLQPGDNRCDH